MSVTDGSVPSTIEDSIRVLHVDDDPAMLELTATSLERVDNRFEVVTETRPKAALDRLDDAAVDCVVSDYQMPSMDGLEFLDAVRERSPDLPFVLFTGKGSEEIASEAISAGVSDYLQKQPGGDQYELLANRVVNAVVQYRTARKHERVHTALQTATEGIGILDEDGRYVYVNETYADLYGLVPSDLVGEHWERLYPEEEVERLREDIMPELERSGEWVGRSRGRRVDGSIFTERLSMTDLESGHVCVVRDITDRVEREHQLQRERDRYQSLFENTNDAVAWTEYSGDTPIIREANPRFRDLFESPDETVVGQPLDDVVTDPDNAERRDRAEEISRQVKAGEHLRGECERDTVDGPRTFLWEAIPYAPPGTEEIRHTHAVYTDISERKAYERQLEQYRTLVETVDDPMFMLDADGTMTMVNDAVVEQWGYARDELEGTHARKVMREKDYQRGTQLIVDLLEGDRSWGSFEMRSETADGEVLLHENKIGVIVENGEHVGTVGILRDITDRTQRERELEASRERYQSLFENNPLVIWEEDFSEAVTYLEEVASDIDDVETYLRDNPEEIDCLLERVEIVDVNRNALDYYDAPSKEVLLDRFDELFAEETYEALASMWAAIADGRTRCRIESVSKTLSGQRRTEIIDVFVPEAYTDDYSRVYITGTDITEQKRQERERKRKNERLEEFTSVVSHDLRNPLNVASGRLDLARDECDSDHLDAVAGAHDRMESLIEDLLTLARQGETVAAVEPVDLASMVSECWQPLSDDGATLVPDTDATITADPDRLRQLLENLLDNALDHAGETVTVTVGDLPNGFYVEDDGAGIPEDQRVRVFEAGVSMSRDGTGFGLSIVERIADAHGWTVELTDGSDGGARFEITGVETDHTE